MSARLYGDSTLDVGETFTMNVDFSAERARREAGEIYKTAARAIDPDPSQFDLDVVEHMLRAVIEVLTPEQRAQILKKVAR